MRARLVIFFVILAFGATGPRVVHGQDAGGAVYTLVLRGARLQEALEELVRITHVDLVYTSELVAGKRVYCAGRELPAEGLLRCLLTGSGLDYVRSSSGAYVLIDARRAPARYGDLTGSVVDGETGAPLPFANVLLADASAGTTTNEAGLFSFASLVSGLHRVIVTYVGYEPRLDSVWIAPEAHERVQIALRPQPAVMKPIVIDGLAQRLPSSDLGLGTITASGLSAVAFAGASDVVRGARRLAGVAAQQPLADLHIQGGGAGEHLTLLDGMPVRNPVSLGRHLGAFSPLALERLTVHKAGFGAEHGSHLSGLVSVTHDVGEENRVALTVDPVSLNGKLQRRFTLPGRRRAAVMIAARSSLWSVYRDPGVDELLRRWNAVDPRLASIWIREPVNTSTFTVSRRRPEVAFSDVHAAVRLRLSPFHLLDASLYRARNRVRSELTAVNALPLTPEDHVMLTRDAYDWSNWVGQIRHTWLLGARSVATVQGGGSWHASQYGYHSRNAPAGASGDPDAVARTIARLAQELDASFGSYEHHEIRELSLHAALNHSFSPQRHVEAGIAARHTDSRLQLGNQFIVPFDYDGAAWELGGYLKGVFTPGLRATIEPSLRLTYLPLRRVVYAEPRLTVRYDRASSRIGAYALRAAAGLYRQYVNQFDLTNSGPTAAVPSILFWLPLDRATAPPRVYHLAADALFMPGETWSLGLEGYYKWQPRLLTLDYAALLALRPDDPSTPIHLSQPAFVAAGRGHAWGGSVRLHRAARRLSATATYSFSHAVRTYPDRFDDRLVDTPWNTPHRLAFDVEAPLASGLSAHINGEGAWGRRWALRQAYYDYLALRETLFDSRPYDLNRPDDHTRPAYFRLDVGLTFAHTWRGATLRLQAYLVNALNRRNVYDWSLEDASGGVGTVARVLPGRYPVFSLRFDY
ncbi:carboxypeptidase regulatory-like domain-containing protein [Rhodocaloribacter sp.]